MSEQNLEQRIEELEIKLTFLDSQHQELNAVVSQLQRENTQLKALCKDLKEQLKNATPSMLAELSEETPPPHY